MDLLLMRHGETNENLNHTIQGWLDTELNENGIKQATLAAEAFNEEIDVIYSSDLKRAKQTAELFRKKFLSIPYYEDDRLRERNFGEAIGLPNAGPDWDAFWSAPPNEAPVPGAESFNEYNNRVQNFIDELRKSNFSKILIITHSGTINRFRELLNGEVHTRHANASIVEIEI